MHCLLLLLWPLLGMALLASMSLAGFGLHAGKHQLGESAEPLLLTLGVALVVGTHFLNLPGRRRHASQ